MIDFGIVEVLASAGLLAGVLLFWWGIEVTNGDGAPEKHMVALFAGQYGGATVFAIFAIHIAMVIVHLKGLSWVASWGVGFLLVLAQAAIACVGVMLTKMLAKLVVNVACFACRIVSAAFRRIGGLVVSQVDDDELDPDIVEP